MGTVHRAPQAREPSADSRGGRPSASVLPTQKSCRPAAQRGTVCAQRYFRKGVFAMQMVMSIKNVSLGVATAAFLMAGSGIALASSQSSGQSSQFRGVNARLDHTLDAQSAHTGEK